jgi:uncharacterized protein YecE (DUF72 family)
MTILVGTASWTDKTLVECGRFYPKGCTTAEARLRFYASQFPLVEVDSSYYAIPAPNVSQLWAERTPADFVFNVKAFRAFTGHPTSPTVLHKDLQEALSGSTKKMLYYRDFPQEILDEMWRRFVEALAPLKEAGKLGAVHFQFAPWLLRNKAGHAHVAHCVERMTGHEVAVEFRNATWFDKEHAAGTLAFERELGVVHTVVDEPQGFPSSIPTIWEATNDRLAIVRLHGRNNSTWDAKGLSSAAERFEYEYSDEELGGLVPHMLHLSKAVRHLHVVLNNCFEDRGQRNARRLMDFLHVRPPSADEQLQLD